MLRSGAAVAALVLALRATACPAAEGVWTHNGSTVRVVHEGDDVAIYYLEPKPALRNLGIAPGQLLFQGKRNEGRLEGLTYAFRHDCAPLGFFVASTDFDQDRIVFSGSEPVRAAKGCAEIGRKNVTLAFQRGATGRSAAEHAVSSHAPLEGKEVVRLLKWMLSEAASEREALYDSCAFLWNKMQWFKRSGTKVLVAGVRQNADGAYIASCFTRTARGLARAAGAIDALAGKAVADCKGHFDGCYLFAAGNRLAEWALVEERRVADGSRLAAAPPARDPSAEAAPASAAVGDASGSPGGEGGESSSGGTGSGLSLDQAIDLSTGLLNGVNALRGLSGGGGGSAGTVHTGGNASCAQAKAHAQTCYQRWKSMGGGMTGQARSFYDCYQVYNNAC
jgi:hypothetical protein